VTEVDWPGEGSAAQVRTDMAWARTALSLVGLAALVARQSGSVVVAVVVLVLAVPAVALLLRDIQRRQPARLAALAAGHDVTAPGSVLALTAITVALALLGLTLVAT
jgi:hypothetical protein